MLWVIYNLLYPVVFFLVLPKYLMRMFRRGGFAQGFGERLGFFSEATRRKLGGVPRVWVHAVSVGEIYVGLQFIREYRRQHPETRFALSTTTSTARSIGEKELHEDDVLFYFPLDLPFILRRVFRIVNPQSIIVVEGEYWPNLVWMATHRGIPVSLINGRMSANSFKGYYRFRSFFGGLLGMISHLCVRAESDAKHFLAVGAPQDRVHTLGSAKYDAAILREGGKEKAEAVLHGLGVPEDALILLGGSTWPGEEEALLDAYLHLRKEYTNLFLVLVPRHVERASEIVPLFDAQSLRYARRSCLEDYDAEQGIPDLLLVDTTGELMNFYACGDIVLVGGGLCVQHGGQNPIEPAMVGKPVITGPSMEDFPAVMEDLLAQDAVIQIPGPEALLSAVEKLLADPEAREAMGRRAAEVVQSRTGVLERTVKIIHGSD